MGQNRKKLPCPKIRIFHYPAVIGFPQKMEVKVMAPNHIRDSLGSILRPMGSHWVQIMCQNSKKLPWPKIRIFNYPAVIDFLQKMEVTVMVPNHGCDTIESILGPMGSHWVQKMGQNRKNYNASKFEFSITPRSSSILGPMGSHWVQKMLRSMAPTVSQWGTPRVHLGANGVPLGPKNGSKP